MALEKTLPLWIGVNIILHCFCLAVVLIQFYGNLWGLRCFFIWLTDLNEHCCDTIEKMAPLYWLSLFSTDVYRAAANYYFHYLLTCQLFSQFPFINCERWKMTVSRALRGFCSIIIINDEKTSCKYIHLRIWN